MLHSVLVQSYPSVYGAYSGGGDKPHTAPMRPYLGQQANQGILAQESTLPYIKRQPSQHHPLPSSQLTSHVWTSDDPQMMVVHDTVIAHKVIGSLMTLHQWMDSAPYLEDSLRHQVRPTVLLPWGGGVINMPWGEGSSTCHGGRGHQHAMGGGIINMP